VSETRLFERLRSSSSLAVLRTVGVLVAASLSISGYVYSYLKDVTVPTHGELLTVVRDRTHTPLSDAQVEVLAPADNAVVASFVAAAPPGGPRILKEGTYRLRVSHPKFATETRMVQVIAGHTSEVRLKLAPRVVATPPPAAPPRAAPSRLDGATRVVTDGVDSIKKIFTK
jgi:hypothetical protein